MKKILFGTIAAATVIASATAASATPNTNRNWSEMRAATTMESTAESPSRRRGIYYGYNLRFERADSVN